MGRTTGNFCSRETIYRYQTDPTPTGLPSLIGIAEEPDGNKMTWQQQKEFGPAIKANERKSKQKAVRWKPLDFEAIVDPPATQTISDGSVQQAEDPVVSLRRQSRGKAAASPLCTSITPASIEFPLQDFTTVKDASIQKKKITRRRGPNKPPTSNTKGNMSRPTTSIPPHLRRKAAAAAAVTAVAAQQKVESSATNGSSVASKSSKPGQGVKLQSSLNSTLNRHSNNTDQTPTPPPSLPTTPRKPERKKTPSLKAVGTIEPQDSSQAEVCNYAAAWDTPKPRPPPQAPKKGNPPWPRLRGALKKTVWPKYSEMKALPTESSSEGGVSCRSNSDGDPNYDVKKLMDWNGDWLPPSEQWSARKGHTSRHFGQEIEQWINGHGEECTKELEYDTSTFHEDGTCKELVPRYWLYSYIESKPLGDFWKKMPGQAPHALSDTDPLTVPPFWEQYRDESSCFIEGLVVPEARVDPEDVDNHDPKGDILGSVNERVRAIEAARARSRRRTLLKQNRPPKDFKPMMPPMEDRRILPKSNVYFRPVQPSDVEGIAAIYNHYVDHTIFATEFDGRTVQQISNRINEIIKSGLPYLVAVAKGNQPRGPQGYVSEKIVGYINLDDYCDQSSMFRYTFEMELYVHPGYQSQNIASCMLDRLLEMANTGYNACGGYDYRNDFQYLKTGPSRVIKTIVLTVLKEHGEDIEKTSAFLKKFNFHCAGHVKQMGFKLGKVVDVFNYRHTTTETIDPNGRPTVAAERV